MEALSRKLRGRLDNTIQEAREVAEEGAYAALHELGVGDAQPPTHLDDAARALRRRLRAHGRQLGDARHPQKETQSVERLIEEVAYEHWHRMLFARFLAENGLLMYPDPDDPVPISLDECDDLATDEGAKNGWELAARYAAGMLPQIFRSDTPVFALSLPPEHQQGLERLLAALPGEVFTSSDALGWVYQFWQTQRKEEVNSAGDKIGARELAAVTQLFTEPYMVAFQLDNALGAWWAARRLSDEDFRHARSESELRDKATIPGVPLSYLRFVQREDGIWEPAAGCFEQWPESLAELKVMDPCCGSGHFLVATLLKLVPIRMQLEDLNAREAVDAVLTDNLHGLELDQRCIEIAAFALALTAWRYPEAGGYRPLPDLHLACSGLSVGVNREEWQKLANGDQNLRIALGLLHDEFRDAPTLGSLIDPRKGDAAKIADWHRIQEAIGHALEAERPDAEREAGVAAQGLAKAAEMLAGEYQWVITNVPYLTRGKQTERLRKFCESRYSAAKNDLATVFLDRCLQYCTEGGTASIVLPQNWLFLTRYNKFREKLLKQDTWHLIARLGPGAFETVSGEVVKAILLTMSRGQQGGAEQGLFQDADAAGLIRGIDVSEPRTAAEKAARLLDDEIKSVEQAGQLENPDARIAFEEVTGELLQRFVGSFQGIKTGDDPAKCRQFWEVLWGARWHGLLSTVDTTKHYGGMESVIDWSQEGRDMSRLQGLSAWERRGVAISQMSKLPVAIYWGSKFDSNVSAVPVRNSKHIDAIWSYCSAPDYHEAVRQIDQQLKVTNAALIQVPFDVERWSTIASQQYPNGLPSPYSDDVTQWIFHGHPCGSVVWDMESKQTANGPLRIDYSVFHIGVARLLGYRWPAEIDSDMDIAGEARELVADCKDLLPFADEDGIVCIPPVRGEATAAERLTELLAAAYGDGWSSATLNALLKAVDCEGKTLEFWLREKFFAQHCRLFHDRPFIWHIWDGLRDGFSALVNYHKLGRKNLETLIYTYIGDWINRQKKDIEAGVDGAEERLAAAEALKKSLQLILEGEAPYDIFVRWKPLEEQPIGWNPDLNDGVRLNIRPFMTVPDVKKKGAGILRDKPKIKWNKDRGKDVESAPWYHLGPEYGESKGSRINDHHLSLAEKKAAQET